MEESLKDKLRVLEARVAVLESILDHVNQGISYFNEDLSLEFCNRRYLELLDFPLSMGAQGAALETFFRFNAERGEYGPGDVEEQVRVRIEQARKHQAHHFERTRPNDGTTLDIVGIPIADGGFVTTYTDVSEHKQLEHDMAQSKQRLELALEGADLGIWDLDITSGTFSNNPRLTGMIGYAPDELVVNAETFASLLHPDDADAFRAAYFAHLQGQTPSLNSEFRARHKDGHWVWILCRGRVVERDCNGRAIRMSGTNLDITERKQSEAALRDSENMLKAIIDNEPECVKLSISVQ